MYLLGFHSFATRRRKHKLMYYPDHHVHHPHLKNFKPLNFETPKPLKLLNSETLKPFYMKVFRLLIIFVLPSLSSFLFANPSEGGRIQVSLYDNLTSPAHTIRLVRNYASEKTDIFSQPIFEIDTARGKARIPIEDIYSIQFTPESRQTIVSDPHETLVMDEGRISMNAPGPAWYDVTFNDSTWEHPILAHPNYKWFYIPGAAWVWSRGGAYGGGAETLLIRRKFTIPENLTPTRALLTITVDDSLRETYLNGIPLPLKNISLTHTYATLDVTLLLRDGENILALKAANKPERVLAFAGVAFRLDIDLVPQQAESRFLPAPAPAVLFLENDDRIWGNLISMSDRWVEMDTPLNRIKIDRDWVRLILLHYAPQGTPGTNLVSQADASPPPRKKRNIFQKLLGIGAKFSPTAHTISPFSLIVYPEDSEGRDGLLLKTGEFINGRVLEIDRRGVTVKPRFGHDFLIDLYQIDAIYPNPPSQKTHIRYPDEDKPWRCEITLLNGTVISGILFDLSPDALTIHPPYAHPMRFKNSTLAHCIFPYVSITRLMKNMAFKKGQYPVAIALIGEMDPGSIPYDHSTYFKIQRILTDLKMESRLLTPEELIDPTIFSVKTYPILLNIDESETYYKTVKKPNDAYGTLVDFVKQGGCLAHLAYGLPAYYGYELQEQRWRRTTTPPLLNDSLFMKILSPGDRSGGALPFELPDNSTSELYFELNTNTPYSIGLPAKVDFPLNPDTRFRPIVPDTTTTSTLFTPIYWLRSDAGQNFGAAMAVIDYSGGGFRHTRTFYVSHLIFTSEFNGHSMLDYLLPRIISMSLKRTGE